MARLGAKEVDMDVMEDDKSCMAITKDRLCAIIPVGMKGHLPFDLVVQESTHEKCVMLLIPATEGGLRGSNAAHNTRGKVDYWSYERHRTKRDRFHEFGRTLVSIENLPDGTIKLETREPLKPVQHKPAGRRRGKAKSDAKIANAVKSLFELPAPGEPKPDIGIGSLRSLVRSINALKDELGNDLCLSIDPNTGKLKAMVEYG